MENYFELRDDPFRPTYRCKLCIALIDAYESRNGLPKRPSYRNRSATYKQDYDAYMKARIKRNQVIREAFGITNKSGSIYTGYNGVVGAGRERHIRKWHPEIKLQMQVKCDHIFQCKKCKKEFSLNTYSTASTNS